MVAIRYLLLLIWIWVCAPGLLHATETRSLTLTECIERALAHNLEIQVERLNPRIETWGIVRQQATFEPSLSGKLSYENESTPVATTGDDSTKSRSLTGKLSLGGTLPTGTEYVLSAYENRTSGTGTDGFDFTGTAAVTLTQPLLKGFGFDANLTHLRVARKSRQLALDGFAQLVLNTVSDVCKAYYELVFAIENHKAKLEDLNRAKALLSDNRKRVELGVLSPLDVTQAEAGVAEREEAVIVAERTIKDRENALKRLILPEVTAFGGQALVPVDYPVVQMVETDVGRSIRAALMQRPDYRQAKERVEQQGLRVRYARNQLWPQVDLTGSYGFNGRAGTFGDVASDWGDARDPVWSVGVVVTVPLGNRRERADYHSARLQAEQALLQLKQLEQNIVVQVDNAVGQVQTNLKRVDATRAASRLAEESLKAEETKLRAGTSTSFLVLQAQAQLASARSAEIRARTDYAISLVELARLEGTLLAQYGITLATED